MTYADAVKAAIDLTAADKVPHDIWEHTGGPGMFPQARFVPRAADAQPPLFDRWTKRATVALDGELTTHDGLAPSLAAIFSAAPVAAPPSLQLPDDVLLALSLAKTALTDAGPSPALDAVTAVLAAVPAPAPSQAQKGIANG